MEVPFIHQNLKVNRRQEREVTEYVHMDASIINTQTRTPHRHSLSHNNTALLDLYSIFEWSACGLSSDALWKQASEWASPFRALVKILLEKAGDMK